MKPPASGGPLAPPSRSGRVVAPSPLRPPSFAPPPPRERPASPLPPPAEPLWPEPASRFPAPVPASPSPRAPAPASPVSRESGSGDVSPHAARRRRIAAARLLFMAVHLLGTKRAPTRVPPIDEAATRKKSRNRR